VIARIELDELSRDRIARRELAKRVGQLLQRAELLVDEPNGGPLGEIALERTRVSKRTRVSSALMSGAI
jgi:hypothetical protein